MKNIFLFCLIGLLSLSAGWTQCDTTYITTNPDAPFNPENPAKLNTFFDWRTQEFDLNYTINGVTNSTTIPSPFYQLSNFGVLHLYQSEDFKPQDGWELIGRDLGYFDNGAPKSDLTHPYLILYNKYTGLMRVFISIGKTEKKYNAMEFRMSFDSQHQRTGLLDYADIPLNAVQAFDISFEQFVATAQFPAEGNKWMMAEFPMAYDPCTCHNPSRFVMEGYMIDSANITISGQSFGSIQPIKMQAGKPRQQQLSVNAAYKKTKDGITAGVKMHKTLIQLVNSLEPMQSSTDTVSSGPGRMKVPPQAKSGIEQLALMLLDKDFLEKGLQFVPFLGEVVETLSVFTAGGKTAVTPQSVTLSPLSTHSTHKFSGQISSSKLYKQITINTPGSNWPGGQGDLYPYYNEVLGMFNLLREPLVEVRNDGQWMYDPEFGLGYKYFHHQQIRLLEDISYVVNPAVFDTSQVEVMGSLFFTSFPVNCANWAQTPLLHVRGDTYRTPFLPISCLKDLVVDIPMDTASDLYITCDPPKVYLQIAANLKPRGNDPDKQRVFFSGFYETKKLQLENMELPFPPLQNNPLSGMMGENVTLAHIQLEGGKTYYATESFTIGTGVTVTGAGQATLVAGREISILENTTLNPGINLETGQPALCNRAIFPARQPEINAVCNSSAYQDRTIVPLQPEPPSQDAPIPAGQSFPLSAYPNPFTQTLTVSFFLIQPGATSARLIDHLGREVMPLWSNVTFDAGQQERTFDLSSLTGGIYLIVMETSYGPRTLRVVKQ